MRQNPKKIATSILGVIISVIAITAILTYIQTRSEKTPVIVFGLTNQAIIYQNLQKIPYVRNKHENIASFEFVPALRVANGVITTNTENEDDLIQETLFVSYLFENDQENFEFFIRLRETFPSYSWEEISSLVPEELLNDYQESFSDIQDQFIAETYPKWQREIDSFYTTNDRPSSIITIDGDVIANNTLVTSYRIENLLVQTQESTEINNTQIAYSSKDCNQDPERYGTFSPDNKETPCSYVNAPEITIEMFAPSDSIQEVVITENFLEANFKNYIIGFTEEERSTVKTVFPPIIESNPAFNRMLENDLITEYENSYRFDLPIQ